MANKKRKRRTSQPTRTIQPEQQKISEMIWQLIKPWIELTDNARELKNLIALAILAWNIALLPETDHKPALSAALNTFKPEIRAFTEAFLLELIERKHTLFPHVNWPISDYQLIPVEGGYHLIIASSPEA